MICPRKRHKMNAEEVIGRGVKKAKRVRAQREQWDKNLAEGTVPKKWLPKEKDQKKD